ncbi:hypothetical protein CLAFUW4_14314 [Fulvia fulva]|uniref:Uncharacterized protein n=1 Tax=Passalora fulva TaxID=5499 RepID=A0A9Q8PMP6_PASFU|nr:uncharacterized protein CLAFUR5_14147 [Fulvia fulva]KAK4609461.1 hypothetical protein CLAFUR4_14314 [Fulvia fulva]KAK4609977.1 hypothetical protein CLAFUR0_14318 [Fulvia fulva]UJO25261.1 hypothetical protein CLAFUR5_14147 [Fulvia fulva]WPV22516.1 hypothetical protein CLAFUW4_14314 [Fulvia fulva]WPV37839.1 hypothetical protein CLAFUW7_14322 [Fulvia fulva]
MDILFGRRSEAWVHQRSPPVVSNANSPSSKTGSWLSTENSSTSTSASTPSDQAPTIADSLIRLIHDYVAAVNDRNWDDFKRLEAYFHPSFTTECRFTCKLQPFQETIDTLKDLVEVSPNFYIKLHEASAKLDDRERTAFVFLHSDWVDAPPGQTIISMQVFEWRHVDGMWLCYKSNVMRGLDDMV